MFCEIKYSIKNPETTQDSSLLNKEILKVMNDPNENGISKTYLTIISTIQEHMGVPTFVPEGDPKRAEYDKFIKMIDNFNKTHLFNPVSGEPVLFSDSVGNRFILNLKNERLYIKRMNITETQRQNLIRGLAFEIIHSDDQNVNILKVLNDFFDEKLLSIAEAKQSIKDTISKMSKEEIKNNREKVKKLMYDLNELGKQETSLTELRNDKFFMRSVLAGIVHETKGAPIQYDRDTNMELELYEEKDASSEIDKYIRSAEEVRDDSTLDPEIFKLLNTVKDFYYTRDGKPVYKIDEKFGLVLAKPMNEVKNRILEIVVNSVGFKEGSEVNPYNVMIEALKDHISQYNDEMIKQFLTNLETLYNAKSPIDKLAFQAKFVKSFLKGDNTYLLTEVVKTEDENRMPVYNFKSVDPSLVQNKRGVVAQNYISTLFYNDALENPELGKFELEIQDGFESKEQVQQLFDILGLEHTPQAVQMLFDNRNNLIKLGSTTSYTLHKLVGDLIDTKVRYIYRRESGEIPLETTIRGAFQMLRDPDVTDSVKRDLKLMLASEAKNTPISILAHVVSETKPSLADSNYNIAGKSRWKYSNVNGYNKLINQWKAGKIDSLRALEHKNLPIVDYLLAKDTVQDGIETLSEDEKSELISKRISKIKLISNAQLREVGGTGAVEFKEVGESDLVYDQMYKMFYHMSELMQSVEEINNRGESAYYSALNKTILPMNYGADKSTSYGLMGFDKLFVDDKMGFDSIREMFFGELESVYKHGKIIDKLYDKTDLVGSNIKLNHDYVTQNLTQDFHFNTNHSDKVVLSESKLGEHYIETKYSYDPVTHKTTVTVYKTEVQEIENNGKKEKKIVVVEDSKNVEYGLNKRLTEVANWKKLGFFNSLVKGNEELFESLFTSMDNTPEGNIRDLAEENSDDNGSTLVSILEVGINEIVDRNLKYYTDPKGIDLSSSQTNIIQSETELGIKRFIMASLVNNIQMFQLFSGDLAFYKQRGDSLSMEDALKRGPAPGTDGLQLLEHDLTTDLDHKYLIGNDTTRTYTTLSGNKVEYNASKQFVRAIVNDIKMDFSKSDAHIKKALEHRQDKREVLEAFKSYAYELADAAGFMTLEHFMLVRAKVYGLTEKDYQIFENLKNPNHMPTEEEIRWTHIAANTHQNLKLVHFENKIIDIEDGLRYTRPEFLKYAPLPLVPALIKGTEMEILMNKMHEQGVDQVIFKSGAKASNGATTTIHKTKKLNAQAVIMEGVESLFNENPELANTVYEALGFKNPKNSWLEYVAERDNISIQEANQRLVDNNTKLISVYRGEGSVVALENTLLPEHIKNSKGRWFTKDRNVAKEYAESHNGVLYSVQIPEVLFNNLSKELDLENTNGGEALLPRELANKKVKEITPEQKQQSLEVYSQYLQQNPNGDIQGFKEFVKNNKESKDDSVREVYDGLDHNLVLNPNTLSYNNLKLQVELPTHFDSENTVGTQHVKNLIANLDLANPDKVYPYKGKMLSAQELFNNYSAAIINILESQSAKFLENYGINIVNGQIDYKNDKLRDMLLSQLDINQDYQMINMMKDPNIPLETIPGFGQRLFPVLAGFIHKKVGKIRTNSGSVIQVANVGFDKFSSEEKSDVINLKNDLELKPPVPINVTNLKMTEFDQLDLDQQTTDDYYEYNRLNKLDDITLAERARLQELSEKLSEMTVYYYIDELTGGTIASLQPEIDGQRGVMKINSAQVMMPFASIQKKLNMTWEEFTVAINESKQMWGTKDERSAPISKELFTNIISYRIPNQSISSNDSLEIVGILPPYMGDMAVVYGEITAKTGSDFDVDKLYLMLPSFEARNKGNLKRLILETYLKPGRAITGIESHTIAFEIKEDLKSISDDNTTDISYESLVDLVYNVANNINNYKIDRDLQQQLLDAMQEGVAKGITDNKLVEGYKERPEFKTTEIIYSQHGIKGYQNDLIESMAAILQSEATYDDLMSPLDSDLIRDSLYEVLYEQYLEENNIKLPTNVTAIISGGQTGVDTIGLIIGKELGLKTGGTAPLGLLRENDDDGEDIRDYGLKEISETDQKEYSNRTGRKDPYTARTEKNVINSDGTVYFNNPGDEKGLIATRRAATENNKPFIANPTPEQLRKFLQKNNIKTLNVAGNRGSKLTEQKSNEIKDILRKALKVETNNSETQDVLTFEEFKKRQVSPLLQVSPMMMIKNRVDMLAAKKLVATMANHMTDIAMTQIQNIHTDINFGLGDGNLSKIFMDEYKGHKHGKSANDYNTYVRKLTQVVSYFMNAAVDAAKDAYIIDGNFNNYTAGAAMLLIRSGISAKEVFKVLLNPTILEVSRLKKSQTEITTTVDLKALELDDKSMIESMKKYYQFLSERPHLKNNKSFDTLLKEMDGDETLLRGFWQSLVELGKELNLDISTSKYDSSGAGKNISEHISLLGNLKKASHSNIVSTRNGKKMVATKLFKNGIEKGKEIPTEFIEPNSTEISELTFLGMFQNNTINLTKTLAEKIFVEATPGYKHMVERILMLSKNPMNYSETSVKDISNYLYGFVLSYSDHRLYNMNKRYSENLLEEINDVYEFLLNQPETKDMELLNQLTMDRFTNKLVFPNGNKFNASDLARMAEEFETIYMQKKAVFRTAAIKLIEYAYITTGFKPTINSYNHLLPKTYFIESGHHVAIQNLLDMLNNPMNESTWNEIAERAYIFSIMNNPRDYRHSKVLNAQKYKIRDNEAIDDPNILKALDKNNDQSFSNFVMTYSKKGKGKSAVYQNKLYIFNRLEEEGPIYTELKIRGFEDDGSTKTEKNFILSDIKSGNIFMDPENNHSITMLSNEAFRHINGNTNNKYYYDYLPITSQIINSLEISDASNKLVTLITDLVKGISNPDEIITKLTSKHRMTKDELLNQWESSETQDIIADIKEAQNC